MNTELFSFAARLRGMIANGHSLSDDPSFSRLALELFALQFHSNPVYRTICEARGLVPGNVDHWTRIPSMPTAAFKELELTSIPAEKRVTVFHSSGTTEQKPSRHFHCRESLAVYETSLWHWFKSNVGVQNEFVSLTPDGQAAPRSSLVHMFETIRHKSTGGFYGRVGADGVWQIDFDAVVQRLKSACDQGRPLSILGTAFSFVHLLDHLAAADLELNLPPGSQVMETGGYKNRSRELPKAELHALIARYLGVPRKSIICEYGMSELSSQAYDTGIHPPSSTLHPRTFRFPPWARVQIISPETGRDVADGETGLVRIFDLANVFSVAAVQTEDLAIRRGDGFELVGRAQMAEPRGCSLMAA